MHFLRDEKTAVMSSQCLKSTLTKSGFNLIRFSSIQATVVANLIDQGDTDESNHRVLGVMWNNKRRLLSQKGVKIKYCRRKIHSTETVVVDRLLI